MRRITLILAVLAASPVFVACGASYPPPNDRVSSTEAASRAAQEVGGNNVPKASLHLRLAQEQLEQAKAQMKEGNNKRADFLLMRATADAELAVSLAKESQARADAQALLDQLGKLQSAPPPPAKPKR